MAILNVAILISVILWIRAERENTREIRASRAALEESNESGREYLATLKDLNAQVIALRERIGA